MVGKALKEAYKKIDLSKKYSLEEALGLVRDLKKEKFVASVDVAINTGLDPRKADQNIRGLVSLPSGLGKKCRVLVFASARFLEKAQESGADHVGGEELIEKVSGGFLDFDRCIATPDMMAMVGKLGRVLGPKGLMPNPKLGTVTENVALAVEKAKSGQMEYRLDKTGIIHGSIGRVDFSLEKLYDNCRVLFSEIWKVRPASAKGELFLKIAVSSTMGVGVPVDVGDIKKLVQK